MPTGEPRWFDASGAPIPASQYNEPIPLGGMLFDEDTGLYRHQQGARWFNPEYGMHLQRAVVSGMGDSDGYTLFGGDFINH